MLVIDKLAVAELARFVRSSAAVWSSVFSQATAVDAVASALEFDNSKAMDIHLDEKAIIVGIPAAPDASSRVIAASGPSSPAHVLAQISRLLRTSPAGGNCEANRHALDITHTANLFGLALPPMNFRPDAGRAGPTDRYEIGSIFEADCDLDVPAMAARLAQRVAQRSAKPAASRLDAEAWQDIWIMGLRKTVITPYAQGRDGAGPAAIITAFYGKPSLTPFSRALTHERLADPGSLAGVTALSAPGGWPRTIESARWSSVDVLFNDAFLMPAWAVLNPRPRTMPPSGNLPGHSAACPLCRVGRMVTKGATGQHPGATPEHLACGRHPECGHIEFPIRAEGVRASIATDDGRYSAEFDAVVFLRDASDTAVLALAACGWAANYPADDVAWHVGELPGYEAVAVILEHCQHADLGFEVAVDEESAMLWLASNRHDVCDVIEAALGTPEPAGDGQDEVSDG